MSQYQRPKYSYDKFDEHRDETPLGKLQQQYWTTKQHMIKKLGKKEDEFVVASDAELDSKLENFESIAHSSEELLKIIDAYQDKLITLSVEEAEMSRFLKSQSTFDTRTQAGKMMSAVSKGQHFSSQQRMSLRLPLVRLSNEVETFRAQAIKDTLMTVRKMEQARTEYRGALLWMRNVSSELDPDAGNKLEKFRRVQARVKRTKARFDRLKGDVIQKIDLLGASRCNMFSHALVNYQQTLILFWQKTAKTMNAIADAFKGYQYYEFNIIKDLVEPSKRVAKMINDKSNEESKKEDETTPKEDNDNKSSENDEKLIDVNESATAPGPDKSSNSDQGEAKNDAVDELNELIDLMTLAEETRLTEQMKELEQLEAEKRQRITGASPASSTGPANLLNKEKSPLIPTTASGLFSFMKKSSPASAETSSKQDLFELLGNTTGQSDPNGIGSSTLKSINDLFSNANDEFEREWQSVFQGQAQIQQSPSQLQNQSADGDATISPSNTEFSLFMTSGDLDKDLMPGLSTGDQPSEGAVKPAASASSSKPSQTNNSKSVNKQNWFDLFAELDPLKNPDAIGKSQNLEEERNC